MLKWAARARVPQVVYSASIRNEAEKERNRAARQMDTLMKVRSRMRRMGRRVVGAIVAAGLLARRCVHACVPDLKVRHNHGGRGGLLGSRHSLPVNTAQKCTNGQRAWLELACSMHSRTPPPHPRMPTPNSTPGAHSHRSCLRP